MHVTELVGLLLLAYCLGVAALTVVRLPRLGDPPEPKLPAPKPIGVDVEFNTVVTCTVEHLETEEDVWGALQYIVSAVPCSSKQLPRPIGPGAYTVELKLTAVLYRTGPSTHSEPDG